MDDVMKLRLEMAFGNRADDDVCIVRVGDLRFLLENVEDADQAYKDGYADGEMGLEEARAYA